MTTLILLAGTGFFAAGALLTSWITSHVFSNRERRLTAERKRLNAAWRYLREIYDVKRSAWMADRFEDATAQSKAESRKPRKSRRRRGTGPR